MPPPLPIQTKVVVERNDQIRNKVGMGMNINPR
jgi:hypothetical protein